MAKKPSKKKMQILGPVDYLVVAFPGNKMNGKIIPELERLEKNGTIRMIDLVVIKKDIHGKVDVLELKELPKNDAFSKFAESMNEWITLDDIDNVAASLPLNCTAGLLLYENTWATKFKQNLLESDAMLIGQGRVPGYLLDAVFQLQQMEE